MIFVCVCVYAAAERGKSNTNEQTTRTHTHARAHNMTAPIHDQHIGFGLTVFHSTRTISFAVRTWSAHIHVACSVLFIVVPPNKYYYSQAIISSVTTEREKSNRPIRKRKNRKNQNIERKILKLNL